MSADAAPGAAPVEAVPAQEDVGTVESAAETYSDYRMRQANRYSGVHGYAAGFANFHEANYGAGIVRGTLLLKPGSVAEYREVYRSELGNTALSNIPELFRRSQDYANAHGLGIALPTFEQGHNGYGVVYGVSFLHYGIAEFRDVPAWELGYPNVADAGSMLRAANDYAVSRGFSAGLPTFHSATYNGIKVYGIHLIHAGWTDARDVLSEVLNLHERFGFEWESVDGEQHARLMRRHEAAYDSIQNCPNLNSFEKGSLRAAYKKAVFTAGTDEAGINARAEVGGTNMWVNFGVLFPQGDIEISQTLIHEMMHIAGYTHPDRTPSDTPYDGGAYYNSPPLRAELCIAGFQSIHSMTEPSRNTPEAY